MKRSNETGKEDTLSPGRDAPSLGLIPGQILHEYHASVRYFDIQSSNRNMTDSPEFTLLA